MIYRIILIYIVLMNLCTFALMGIDKRRAKKHNWRISERMLFIPVLLGGGIGGTAGMKVFHHKTKHWYFHYGFPFITIVEYAAFVYIILSYLLK